jgi:hypothetical protein
MTLRNLVVCTLFALGSTGAVAAKPKHVLSSSRAEPRGGAEASVKPAAKSKPVVATAASAAKTLAASDQACTVDWLRGDVISTRSRCGDLKPSNSPVATYWRMVLSDDPVELRKGLSAVALKEIEAEPRLLLLAGRYQFSRGETRELSDLAWLCTKRKLKGPEVDTLKRLSEGK